jgi:hypothetical protein
MMVKIAAIVGGVLLMAGVAVAGTLTSLGSDTSPTINPASPPDRGRENELRGRANEPGEDVRGPCDEAEHANDPRCVGTATTPQRGDDDAVDNGRGDDGAQHRRGHDDGTDDNSGPGGGDDSGHHGGGDDSGHGGRDD